MNDLPLLVPRIFPADSIVAGFTTRRGGVSTPPFDSLNMGFNTADDPGAVSENHRILFDHIGIAEDRAALMGQVHGSYVRIVESGGLYPETDAIITSQTGLLLGVRVADCVPLLIHDASKGIAGAVHCGWKPIASGIIERTVDTMRQAWNSEPADIRAALGPSAGPCCYEIGPEVAARLSQQAIREREGRFSRICGRNHPQAREYRDYRRPDRNDRSLHDLWRIALLFPSTRRRPFRRMMGFIMLGIKATYKKDKNRFTTEARIIHESVYAIP